MITDKIRKQDARQASRYYSARGRYFGARGFSHSLCAVSVTPAASERRETLLPTRLNPNLLFLSTFISDSVRPFPFRPGRTHSCGICGTSLSFFHADTSPASGRGLLSLFQLITAKTNPAL